jgi:hypothetical protein
MRKCLTIPKCPGERRCVGLVAVKTKTTRSGGSCLYRSILHIQKVELRQQFVNQSESRSSITKTNFKVLNTDLVFKTTSANGAPMPRNTSMANK